MTGMARLRVVGALIVLALAVCSAPVGAQSDDSVASDEEALVLFWGDGCPHCEAERQFLVELQANFPGLEIRQYEVWNDAANRARFELTMASFGEDAQSVPTTVYLGRVYVGFSNELGEYLRGVVESRHGATTVTAPSEPEVSVSVPFIGSIDVQHQPLIFSTLAIGFVDGFNPCSLWVLSILLALVLRTGSRRRVMAIGSAFLVVTVGLYGLYIVGLYSVLSFVAYSAWVRVAMALVALAFGAINLRDYFSHRGFTLSIPESKKPGLYQRMRAVARVDNRLPSALFGTAVLAVGVSILETPCTAGYPLLWADLLAEQQVPLADAAFLFALYMLVFLLDELLVFGAAVVAMRSSKIEERHGRLLKLVSGSVMVSLAGVLVFFPPTMESIAGAAGVFGAAGLLALCLALADRFLQPRRDRTPHRR